MDEEKSLQNVDREFRAAVAKLTGGLSPQDYAAAWSDWWLHLSASPAKQMQIMQSAYTKAADLWNFSAQAAQGQPVSPQDATHADRRFAGDAWNQFPFNVYARAFQNNAELLREATSDVEGVQERSAQMMEFAARQVADATSPSNYVPTNPELIQQTIAEKGENLARGWKYFLEDMDRTIKGGTTPGAEKFKVGEDIAATPGKVVFRNSLIELIQYSPTTPDVHAEPVLIVPAWIMKYYILDLSSRNSLVKWLVDQGHTVFMISWKNPSATDREVGMDDYLRNGIYAAMDAVCDIVPKRKVHAVGYCIGGTLLAIGAAALARKGDERIKDITMFAAQTDFSEPGELSLFISPSQLAMLEALMFKEGVLDSAKMGGAFALLRAHDLLWQPSVNTYLKGKREELIDLMAWNADGTRMPWKMHTEYLYGLYLNDDLANGRFKVEGEVVQLSDIKVPMFVVGTETDHVAPWKSVFKVDRLADSSEFTFLLTSGGHNAGIISGPVHPKRHHRVRTRKGDEPRLAAGEWFATTAKAPGSWWPVWGQWLAQHSDAGRAAPPALGSASYAPVADAPGEYVLQR
ncbi:MAG: polyhydroxyalkanoic acid synthase [Steroidobacteraceae bacterium]|nr:polyhydroxyalkanoic acid synthase [Steroidobacteraceae bacterium]